MPFKKLITLCVLPWLASTVFAVDDLVFAKDSEWEIVSSGLNFAEGMAWDSAGHFYFTDVPKRHLYKIDKDSGEQTLVVDGTGRSNGIAVGPDGRLYGCAKESLGINAWDLDTWEMTTYGKGAESNDLTILDNGIILFTDPDTGSIWRLDVETDERTQAVGTDFRPNGIALSPDQKTLYVAEFRADRIHAYPIDEDGFVQGEGYVAYRLAVASHGRGFLDGMLVLPDGRLLIGTSVGIQLAEPVAKETDGPRTILVPHPQQFPRCNYVRISPDGEWMYAVFVKEVQRRRINPDLLR